MVLLLLLLVAVHWPLAPPLALWQPSISTALVAACLTRAPCGVLLRFGAGRRRATWLGGGGGGGSGLGLLSSFRRRGTAS